MDELKIAFTDIPEDNVLQLLLRMMLQDIDIETKKAVIK